MRRVLFTGDIFRLQARGGITRYVVEVARRLTRPAAVIAGLHRSEDLTALGGVAHDAWRAPALWQRLRVAPIINAMLDAAALKGPGAILHPTYYRDPASLPRRTPLVLTVHDMTHERFPALAHTGPERWKRALAERAERVVCYSDATRRDCIDLLGLPESKLRVTPLAGRDWASIMPAPIAQVREPFVLWVGERHAYKNFPAALRAWSDCGAARDTTLLCIGGAPWSARERESFAALGVEGRVRHHVATDGELRWAYQRALGLFYPSLWEGFGIPVVEAMALGCPVVTSNTSSLPEVGGDVAWYVDPASHESMVEGVARLADTTRDVLHTAALVAQAERFSWDRTAALHEDIYRELDS